MVTSASEQRFVVSKMLCWALPATNDVQTCLILDKWTSAAEQRRLPVHPADLVAVMRALAWGASHACMYACMLHVGLIHLRDIPVD